MLHVVLYETAFAPTYNDNLGVEEDERAIVALEAYLTELSVPAFLWWPGPELPPVRFFGGPDVLVADHARTWLWATALTPAALADLRRNVAGDWELAT